MPKPFSKTCIASRLPLLVRQAAFRKARRSAFAAIWRRLGSFRRRHFRVRWSVWRKVSDGQERVPDRRWGPSFVARMMPRRAKWPNSREKEYDPRYRMSARTMSAARDHRTCVAACGLRRIRKRAASVTFGPVVLGRSGTVLRRMSKRRVKRIQLGIRTLRMRVKNGHTYGNTAFGLGVSRAVVRKAIEDAPLAKKHRRAEVQAT
jgi:hypothetical protein